ncbi:KRUF family protein [Toxoplasma gondii VAND]|uniref:KRUF family protein n=1 Tax=Toxoplasma gondii VAND TaxID=933077 RepID=A0A086PJ74_TOXGO|nr:KRUF family protein [Toxoplasma gondii VAND]
MVTRLALLRTALAAISCSVEQVICGRPCPGWICIAWILSRNLWAQTLILLQNTVSYPGACAASVPGDKGLDKKDLTGQPLPVSEAELEAAQALLALSARSAIDTSGTQEEPAASAAAAPPGGRGPTPGAADPSTRRRRSAGACRRRKDSGSRSSAPGGEGLARTVLLEGRGEVTYGQLALGKLRSDAKTLREEWGSEDNYVARSVGRLIVSQSGPVQWSRLQGWVERAQKRFQERSSVRLREAAKLEDMAEEVKQRLAAAGVHLPSSSGDSSPQAGTRDQPSRTGADAGSPDTASVSAPVLTKKSCVMIGIAELRRQSKELREIWTSREEYIEQHVADRMVRTPNRNVPDRFVGEWRQAARTRYNERVTQRLEKAAELEATANAWDRRIASDAEIWEDVEEGTPVGAGEAQQVAALMRPAGRPVIRGLKYYKQGTADESMTITSSAGPSESGAPESAAQMGSLSGTVLGSTILLPQRGAVTYVQLAIERMRQEARALLYRWGDVESFLHRNIALRMYRLNNRSPSVETVRQWLQLARSKYRHRGRMRCQDAENLNIMANELERNAEAAGISLRTAQETATLESGSPGQAPVAQAAGTPRGEFGALNGMFQLCADEDRSIWP